MKRSVMKSKLTVLLSVFKEYLIQFSIHIGALSPLLLLLDFGMGIQLYRDYGLTIVVGFVSALVFLLCCLC